MRKRLLDILLLPKSTYQKITDKKPTLYAGILFVGAVDIIFPLVAKYLDVFRGKPSTTLNYNIGLILIFAVILGLVDIMFFSLPLFDLFKFLKKGAVGNVNSTLVRFTKVYIVAHLIVMPFNVLFMLPLFNSKGIIIPDILVILSAIYFYILMPAWFSGIIARGTNVLFNMELKFVPLVFAAVFTWNYLLSEYALDYVLSNWVMYFFK